jgi:hypothetical protein
MQPKLGGVAEVLNERAVLDRSAFAGRELCEGNTTQTASRPMFARVD